jgi:hypothetical protein
MLSRGVSNKLKSKYVARPIHIKDNKLAFLLASDKAILYFRYNYSPKPIGMREIE